MLLCAHPRRSSYGNEFPCSRCLPCKINKQRIWKSRLLLEAGLYADNVSATLTIGDLSPSQAGPPQRRAIELIPEDMTLFLKRLRKALGDVRFRYYYVGEYGTRGGRPHYHILFFGLGMQHEQMIANAWGHGGIQVGDASPQFIVYTLDHLTTKDTHVTRIREDGRHPEFHRMSRGLGAGAVPMLRQAIISGDGEIFLPDGDVPCQMRIEGKLAPLGSFLVKKFRQSLQRDVGVPRETGLLRSLLNTAECAEEREKRRAHTALTTAVRAKINQSKRKV